jgi:hypothetical protein
MMRYYIALLLPFVQQIQMQIQIQIQIRQVSVAAVAGGGGSTMIMTSSIQPSNHPAIHLSL